LSNSVADNSVTAELDPRVGLWRTLLALLLAGLFGVVAIARIRLR